jgi:hypothetical protein
VWDNHTKPLALHTTQGNESLDNRTIPTGAMKNNAQCIDLSDLKKHIY